MGSGAELRSDQVRLIQPLVDFFHRELAGSVLIVVGIVVALVWANSPWSDSYREFWSTTMGLEVGDWALSLDLRHWVADGAMALFFFVVGLEIKRELTTGELRDPRQAAVPVIAAVGGMIVPALVYLAIAQGQPRGWAVPTATDIALAVGLLALAGDRVAPSLRAFLLTLAIVDDILAVVVIALAYSDQLGSVALAAAFGLTVAGVVLRKRMTIGYLTLFTILLWLLLHEAGVHATLAGVVGALLAPSAPHRLADLIDADELVDIAGYESAFRTVALARASVSTAERLEHVLHPWSSLLVVPLFALASAGVRINGTSFGAALESSVAWGIIAGLVIGKPIGIVLATGLAIRIPGVSMPGGMSLRHAFAAGSIAGIGFTISIVIAGRAYPSEALRELATLAILGASIAAAALGYLLLRLIPGPADQSV